VGEHDEHAAQVEGWRTVAAGWTRRRGLLWESTRAVSERLVELLAPRPGEQVLDVAAGPGDTGLLAAPLLEPGGRLVSTDAVAEMLDAGRQRAAELGVTNVAFVTGDATDLPFDDGAFDGVLCRFGVMLVPDCAAAAREIRRVLDPGGRAAIAVWAESGRNPWMTAAGRAALALGLVEPPDRDAPGPFRLGAPGRLGAELEAGGLRVEREEEVAVTWRASSLDEWWGTSLDTSRLLGQLVEQLDVATIARLRADAEERLGEYVAAGGAVAVPGVARVALARPDSRS
jgi:SAM-dependent methyltransferase